MAVAVVVREGEDYTHPVAQDEAEVAQAEAGLGLGVEAAQAMGLGLVAATGGLGWAEG